MGLDPSHPLGTDENSISIAWDKSTDTAKEIQKQATITTHAYGVNACKKFQANIELLDPVTRQRAIHTLNTSTLPTNALYIRKQTEQILWHQRLGHPCNEYLYNANHAIKGVPLFKSNTLILDTCPTCIRATQTKARTQLPISGQVTSTSKPTMRSTMKAQHPHQWLLINFSFSGMNASNTSATMTMKESMERPLEL